ncbi:MAG: hypothetical protein IKA85_06620 [Clostridia bacterium]|nr:hypothetical protein [Clostridia bacterium]
MILLAIILIIIFLPLYISVYLYNNSKDKRIYFAIYLFNAIKLLDGYTTPRKLGGIYIHVFKDKAYVLDIETIKRLEGGSVNFFSAITPTNLYFSLDFGIKNANLVSLLLILFNTYINLGKFIKDKYPYFNSYANLNVYSIDKNYLSSKISLTFCFNIFCILVKIITNIISRGVKSEKKYFKT